MKSELQKYYETLKARGLTPEQEKKILFELHAHGSHVCPEQSFNSERDIFSDISKGLYSYNDSNLLQGLSVQMNSYIAGLRSLDELLERDKQREEDGFPRKIRVGRLIKPGKGGKDKIVVVPTTVEEKFIHDPSLKDEEEEGSGGAGEGEEGEIIGEQPVRDPDAPGSGPGEGQGASHEIESSAYDLGKILTEQFKLPNLKEKGKKRSLTSYTYDMTDRHRGFGQILDKKATLRKVVETNISLGNIPDINDIDPTSFLISPSDKIYRILSREKTYESQAMVFFLRDYSGSMIGKPTEIVVSQHVLIYSWLSYQYAKQVESRFILHDTDATEVPDFYTYYNSKVAGGTKIASAYRLVNEIVEKENLTKEYNIYIFHGTDGDDWDTEGVESVPELKQMMTYANRVGITIAKNSNGSSTGRGTDLEKYLKTSKLLKEKPDLIRLDILRTDADEARLIEGIKKLIS